MTDILIPLPHRDFDPSEAAVTWQVLTGVGHRVTFATPAGLPASADEIMLTGRGLDPWSRLPGVGRLRVLGGVLRANRDARSAYAHMIEDPAFRSPIRWADAVAAPFGGLVLVGGHRARGMREHLESPVLQRLVADFFSADQPVGAICHGVVLAARSTTADGVSVLHGRRTTALTWRLERTASRLAHVGRFWDPGYYRTYTEGPGEPAGFRSVEHEVRRALRTPQDFLDVPADARHRRAKVSGTRRDSLTDESPAWVVTDANYVSARWPGDVHTFARTFADLLGGRASDPR